MNPSEYHTLARKLEYLRKQLTMLDGYSSGPKAALTQMETIYAIERLIDWCCHSVQDVSRLLVAVEDWRRLRDERDALLILQDRGILKSALVKRLCHFQELRTSLLDDPAPLNRVRLARTLKTFPHDCWAFAKAIATELSKR